MPGLKYSRQRESIINCLKGRKDHPTADMIYASVREEYPKISLGTVYRNLSLLVDQGEILPDPLIKKGFCKPFFISGSGRNSPLFMRGRTGSL